MRSEKASLAIPKFHFFQFHNECYGWAYGVVGLALRIGN